MVITHLKMNFVKSFMHKHNPTYGKISITSSQFKQLYRYREFNEKGELFIKTANTKMEKREVISLRISLHSLYKLYQMKNQKSPKISYVAMEFILRLICSYVFYPDYGMDKFHSQYMECLVQKLIRFNRFFNLKCKNTVKLFGNYTTLCGKLSEMYKDVFNMKNITFNLNRNSDISVFDIINAIQSLLTKNERELLPFVITKNMLV